MSLLVDRIKFVTKTRTAFTMCGAAGLDLEGPPRTQRERHDSLRTGICRWRVCGNLRPSFAFRTADLGWRSVAATLLRLSLLSTG